MFGRLAFYAECLTEVDCLWCLDTDAIITNQSIRIAEAVSPRRDLTISVDRLGINAGSYFLRNTPWSFWMLQKVLDLEPHFRHAIHRDQTAMWMTLPAEHEHVEFVNQRVCNSYLHGLYDVPANPAGEWAEGDFVLHLPGLEDAMRAAIIADTFPKVIR